MPTSIVSPNFNWLTKSDRQAGFFLLSREAYAKRTPSVTTTYNMVDGRLILSATVQLTNFHVKLILQCRGEEGSAS